MPNNKHAVILALYNLCKQNNNFIFDNELVKDICKQKGFGNPFDITKLDNQSKLPQLLIDNDTAIIHLGSGKHKFIKGINKIYHHFEPIQQTIDWQYQKSILNHFNSSESNLLSVANNQRILHHFVFGQDNEFNSMEIIKRPKTYFPHRTKTNFEYYFDNHPLSLNNIQIEVDLTIEFNGTVAVFEGKNGKPDNFSIYQIYHSFLYYYNASQNTELRGKIKNIVACYVVRQLNTIKCYLYSWENPLEITSIQLLKSIQYNLIENKQANLLQNG